MPDHNHYGTDVTSHAYPISNPPLTTSGSSFPSYCSVHVMDGHFFTCAECHALVAPIHWGHHQAFHSRSAIVMPDTLTCSICWATIQEHHWNGHRMYHDNLDKTQRLLDRIEMLLLTEVRGVLGKFERGEIDEI